MPHYFLKNDSLTIRLEEHGAEMTSILDQHTNTEYLWKADPIYWKRHSPILFPFVGSLKNKSYSYQGHTYPVMQHGFARDMDFQLMRQSEGEIWFSLKDSLETFEIYPFHFRLELGYRLEGRKITVLWKVYNKGQSELYFSIGGHPAFNCPLDEAEDQSDYFICFDTEKPLYYLHVDENGLAEKKQKNKLNVLTTDHGIIPVDSHMFDYDALIIEENQCHKISLLSPLRVPYLTITFDAPLFGLWSPPKKNAPFVCIEPWYGRCDANNFNGTLKEREWGNTLQKDGIFEASYTIEIAPICSRD